MERTFEQAVASDMKRLNDAAAPFHASLVVAMDRVNEIGERLIRAYVADMERLGRALRQP